MPPTALCLRESLLQGRSDPSGKHPLHRAANGNQMAERGLSPSALGRFPEPETLRLSEGPAPGWGPREQPWGGKGSRSHPRVGNARLGRQEWGISLRGHPQ